MSDTKYAKAAAAKSETPSEVVDGPGVAARILNRLDASKRQRLLESIGKASPEALQRISQKLVTFEDIAGLTDKGAQRLISEVAHDDLVLSLKSASAEVSRKLLSNLSQRKREIVTEDLQALPRTPVEKVEQAQQRILHRLDDLRASGAVRTEGEDDVWV